jgi:hypothetical protein
VEHNLDAARKPPRGWHAHVHAQRKGGDAEPRELLSLAPSVQKVTAPACHCSVMIVKASVKEHDDQ